MVYSPVCLQGSHCGLGYRAAQSSTWFNYACQFACSRCSSNPYPHPCPPVCRPTGAAPAPADSAAGQLTQEQLRARSEAQLRFLRELLRKDYALGYLLLGWLLRCTWTLAPALAGLLGLPRPEPLVQGQLPALLLWLLQVGAAWGVWGTLAGGVVSHHMLPAVWALPLALLDPLAP